MRVWVGVLARTTEFSEVNFGAWRLVGRFAGRRWALDEMTYGDWAGRLPDGAGALAFSLLDGRRPRSAA